MHTNACVSVIVPIYDQEKYLDASIPSVRQQTYQNLQIILVNDGSTDNSPAMLRRYAAEDPRIEVIDKHNGGLVDATLAGIQAARGEYICFLDPDDMLGKDYVQTFMKHMKPEYDFVAAGFYYEDKGVLMPCSLRRDRVYSREELQRHRDDFLSQKGHSGISNRFFISRWNKLYRTELVRKVAARFCDCRHISLGEDTLFTYLMLSYSRGGKTLSHPNSYYYNIGNQNSMMKTGRAQAQIGKALDAYTMLKGYTEEFGTSDTQADALYGFLVDTTLHKLRSADRRQYVKLVRKLRKDSVYQRACRVLADPPRSGVKKLYRQLVPKNSDIDLLLWPIKSVAKRCVRTLRTWMRYVRFFLSKCKTKGVVRAARLLRFQRDRDQAFTQMVRLLKKMEGRILPFLQPYLEESSRLEDCPLEKNIFVFWWDGLDKAPVIVRRCFASAKRWNPDCRVILVDKDNYRQYTDIDSVIIDAFNKDKISVQTFSDILRFNLLKNNGGIWVDATIFFTSECNLLKDLEHKSFTSLAFSTSADFLEYEGIPCTWSGFFIASRKNGLFVRAVDAVFRQYYMKYHTYSTYFFIDITLMLCKKYRIDADVLSKTLRTQRSMFTLARLLDAPFDADVLDLIQAVPQKLVWSLSPETEGTFYGWMLSQYNE